MASKRESLINYINFISDESVEILEPLVKLLVFNQEYIVEKIGWEELTQEEQREINQMKEEVKNGEYLTFEEAMSILQE